jgi:transforming growth factor-beta-induced protein
LITMQFAILLATGLIGSIGVHAATPATVVAVIQGSADHSNLASALTTNDLVTTLSSAAAVTVFAPTNAVMPASFPKTAANTAQLKYHVVDIAKVMISDMSACAMVPTASGKKVKAMKSAAGVLTLFDGTNTATVTTADLDSGNGVVHVIDKVLAPPTDDSVLPACPPEFVFDVVQQSSAHSKMTESLNNNDLQSTLKSAGPFTVFAPTDTALPAALTKSAANKAQLTYHAISGKFLKSSLSSCAVVASAQGKKIKVMKSAAGVVTLFDGTNTATVTTADLIAGNGVVHVIDKVLTLPTDDSGLACPTTAPTTAPTAAPAAAGAFQRSVGLLALVIGTTSLFF